MKQPSEWVGLPIYWDHGTEYNTTKPTQGKGLTLTLIYETYLCGVPQVDRGTLCGTIGLRMRANQIGPWLKRLESFLARKLHLHQYTIVKWDGTKLDRAVISRCHLSAWTMIVLIKFSIVLFGDCKGIPMHQSMSYLKFVCKSYKGWKLCLVDGPEPTWGFNV